MSNYKHIDLLKSAADRAEKYSIDKILSHYNQKVESTEHTITLE